MRALGLLVRAGEGTPPPPEQNALGRAGLLLRAEGVPVVFGERTRDGCMSGWLPLPGRWAPVDDVPVAAVHDRYPSFGFPERHARALAGLAGVPVANPPEAARLCRDKLACQRFLEAAGLPLPEVEPDPARFAERLRAWGAGFLKPRYGALGRGVRRVVPGDPLPARGEGAVAGVEEPLVLQRAVPPPRGLAGACLRVLVQREPVGGFVVAARVLRRSGDDPVANVARGARVDPAEDVYGPGAVARLDAAALAAVRALAASPWGQWLVEAGVDLVPDPEEAFHLLEVNHRPLGRLEVLAALDPARFDAPWVAACARPLQTLRAQAVGIRATSRPGSPAG